MGSGNVTVQVPLQGVLEVRGGFRQGDQEADD